MNSASPARSGRKPISTRAIQQHADIVREFFGLLAPNGSEALPAEDEPGCLPYAIYELTEQEEHSLLRFSFMTPEDLEQELEDTQRLLRDSHLRRAQSKLNAEPSNDADVDERRILELHAQLSELSTAWRIVQAARVPSRMMLKDFVEGNVYGAVLTLFMETLRGDFDDLAIVQAIGKESPTYRRRLAARLLGDPDAPDVALSAVIQRNVKALVGRSNSPYMMVAGNRYRRIYL